MWNISVDRMLRVKWEWLGSASWFCLHEAEPSRPTRFSYSCLLPFSSPLSGIISNNEEDPYQKGACPFQHRHPCVSYASPYYEVLVVHTGRVWLRRFTTCISTFCKVSRDWPNFDKIGMSAALGPIFGNVAKSCPLIKPAKPDPVRM